MKVRIDEVPSTGLTLRWEEPPACLDERLGHKSTDLFEARTPIEAALVAARVGRAVAVVGRVGAVVGLACGRCLRPIDSRFDLQVAFVFVPRRERSASAAWDRSASAGGDRSASTQDRASSGRDRSASGRAPRAEDEELDEPLDWLDLSGLPVELPGDDLEVLEYMGPEIDLTQAVVDQVVLALPLQPRCSDACKGLCPRCGYDLNLGQCGCADDQGDPRLAALRSLKPSR